MKRLIIASVLLLSALNANAACEISGRVLAMGAHWTNVAFIYVSPTNSWNDFYLFSVPTDDARTLAIASGNASTVKWAYVVGTAASCTQNGYNGEIAWIGAS